MRGSFADDVLDAPLAPLTPGRCNIRQLAPILDGPAGICLTRASGRDRAGLAKGIVLSSLLLLRHECLLIVTLELTLNSPLSSEFFGAC